VRKKSTSRSMSESNLLMSSLPGFIFLIK
jgi:hypothetical protein